MGGVVVRRGVRAAAGVVTMRVKCRAMAADGNERSANFCS